MTHLVIIMPGSRQRIERWTDTPELTERFYRDAGAYVFESGSPQPVRGGDGADRCFALVG